MISFEHEIVLLKMFSYLRRQGVEQEVLEPPWIASVHRQQSIDNININDVFLTPVLNN